MTNDELRAREQEVLAAANIEDAIRLSGELLAEVDNALRLKVNAHEERSEECRLLARECALHLHMLQQAGQMPQVYASALTALLMLDIAGADTESSRLNEVFMLTAQATLAFGTMTDQMLDDEFTAEHVPVLFHLWGSRLYYYYQKCDKAAVALQPLVKSAHDILQQLIEANAVTWPDVTIQGRQCSVQSNAVLADIIGRSIALGIFTAG